jgi:hypothetical protein
MPVMYLEKSKMLHNFFNALSAKFVDAVHLKNGEVTAIDASEGKCFVVVRYLAYHVTPIMSTSKRLESILADPTINWIEYNE